MFLGLGTVVIMNLLIGLTVSSTEELRSQAGVLRLKRTAEEVITMEGILANYNTTIFRILPKWLRENLSNYGQFFNYVKWKKRNNATSSTKVCFLPNFLPASSGKLANRFRTNVNQRTDFSEGIDFDSKYVELYLYNECMGTIAEKTNFTLPSSIVYKTLEVLANR